MAELRKILIGDYPKMNKNHNYAKLSVFRSTKMSRKGRARFVIQNNISIIRDVVDMESKLLDKAEEPGRGVTAITERAADG